MAGAPAIGGIGLVVIILIGLFLGVDVSRRSSTRAACPSAAEGAR